MSPTSPAKPGPLRLTFRAPHPHEAHAIAQRNIEMAHETEGLALDPEAALRGTEAALRGEVGARYLLAEAQGQVVGQLMITAEWSDWRARWVWWIQSVYVLPAHRGRGIYAAMYAHVRAQAAEAGVAVLRLYVDTRNTHAQDVYRRLGMNGDHYALFEQELSVEDEPVGPVRYAPDPGEE